MATSYVVDASVVVPLFMLERHSDAAVTFFDAIATPGMRFLAPDALYYEVTATLRSYERRKMLSTPLDLALTRVTGFDIRVTLCRDLALHAARISRQHLIAPYDAFYVALAEREGAPLVTVDSRLVGATQGKGFDVQHLSDVI